MQAYREISFEPTTESYPDLNDYYDSVPPAHRLSGHYSPPSISSRSASRNAAGGLGSGIPLSSAPYSSSAASTNYQSIGAYNRPFTAESAEDLHTPTATSYTHGGSLGVPMGGATPYTMAPAPNATYPVERNYGVVNTASYDSGMAREPKVEDVSNSAWMEPAPPKSNRKKWIVMGACLAVAGIIIIAIVVGVVVSQNSKKSAKNLSTSVSSNSTVVQTDPNDPSQFTKDVNLHQSFYGMAYTPVGSQLPDCGNSLPAVIQDIQIMSQLTKRIRLYGADCNQSALVLEAIKQTKVDMTVWLGNYPIATDNNAAYQRQRDIIKDAIQTYGTDHIGGVTVGNEFMLNYLDANSATDPNSAVGNQGAQILMADIQDTRSMLSSIGVNIPVGTADAGSYFNNEVLAAVDYGMANVHPWFANVSADTSAGWTANFFQQQDVAIATTLPNNPQMYIAETGWPTKSSDAGNASNGPSTASVENLQIFLDTFVCQSNNNGTGYFFFEFCDEDWKDKQFGGVEGWWGLFNQDRSLKNVTIPSCQSP